MLTIQVVASLLLVAAVLWFLWRLPRSSGALDWLAPPLALSSAWVGLAALPASAALWVLPNPDRWVAVSLLLLDPAALALGVGVMWIYRGRKGESHTVTLQRTQARVGITLGLLAVTVGYLYVLTHKTPFTPTGP